MFNPRDYLAKKYVEEKEREEAIRDRGFETQHQADEALRREIFDPIKGASYLYDTANFVTSPISKYFTGQGNQGVLSKAKEMQAALREPVVEPVDTSALREAAGYRLAAEGLDATDFSLSPDMAEGSADNTIEESGPIDSIGPIPADDGMTARSLLRRALEASRNPIDMQRFEQLAQDRKRDGGLSMITSLAAGEAGPRYSDYKENYLKKAMAEKGQQQLGDYGFASGGQFYETPGIQQAREAETDMAGAELLFDAEEADARRLNKTLTANQYSKLMAEADTDQIALDQLDQVLATFEVSEGGADRGFTVWTDQVTANAKNFFGKQASRDEFRLMSRDAKLQQIIGLFRTEIVGPGIVTEYDAERILKSVGGNVGAFQNPDIVREQLDILRQQKLKALATKKRQLDYFGRAYPGLYGSVAAPSGLSLGANDADAGQDNAYTVNY